jgi:hypothetical protein
VDPLVKFLDRKIPMAYSWMYKSGIRKDGLTDGKPSFDLIRRWSMEPTKIFFDMLFDYRYLKYIFKYGFFWDDDITKFLLSKSSQRVRELSNAISDSVYENCVTEPWYEHANGGRTKKSGRLLVRQNHYRLVSESVRLLWELFGYGGGRDDQEVYAGAVQPLQGREGERGVSLQKTLQF